MEAVKEMVEVAGKIGEIETAAKMNQIQALNDEEAVREDIERSKAKQSSDSNKFITELMVRLK